MSKSTVLNFEGQKFFVGIDAHKANWKVTVRTRDMFLTTVSMDPSPEKLHSFLTKKYPGGSFFSVYEAGFCGFWIHRDLIKLGIKNMVVNAADVPTTNKEKDRKSDPIDSNKLSRELSNGNLQGIYVPNHNEQSIRILSRCVQQYSRRSTQVKTRIKSLLSYLGIRCDRDSDKRWSAAFVKSLSEIQFPEPANFAVMQTHLEELAHIRKQQLNLLREVRRANKGNKLHQKLRTAPGVGVITSLALQAELVDMKRFKNLDNTASFVGLVPSTSSSDKTEINKGMTNRHCKYLRHLLIEAAWAATRVDPVFTKSFQQLCMRMSKKRAIVKMAKKLLSRIRAIWLDEQDYAIGTIETKRTKTQKSCELELSLAN